MSNSLILRITDAGRAAIVNNQNTGTAPLIITHIAIGSGLYQTTDDQTQLQNEIKRLTTFGGQAVAADTVHITVLDESTDTYSLGEFGLITDTGVLFAVYSGKTARVLEKAAGGMMVLSVDAIITSVNVQNLSFAGTGFMLPPGTKTVPGILRLADNAAALQGTDDQKAMTPKTTKAVIDQHKTEDNAHRWGQIADKPAEVSQAHAEGGTVQTIRQWSPLRIRQAILGWWNSSSAKTKLDGIAAEATKNATDAQLRERGSHTGTQAISTIAGLENALATKLNRNDPSVTNEREWLAETVPRAEAEAGQATHRRAWTAQRVWQAIAAWWVSAASAWGRSFVQSVEATSARLALGLGTAATRNVGVLGDQVRTNSQNDGRFGQLKANNSWGGTQTFESGLRAGVPPEFWSDTGREYFTAFSYFGSAGSYKTGMYFNGYRGQGDAWRSFGVNGLSSAAAIELGGVAGRIEFRIASKFPTGSAAVPPLAGYVDSDAGFVWGRPSGGSKGQGSINAEIIYINGVEIFEDVSGIYTAGPGALANAVSSMLRSNTATEIRASIGAGTGDGDAKLGVGTGQVRTNLQNDGRFGRLDFDNIWRGTQRFESGLRAGVPSDFWSSTGREYFTSFSYFGSAGSYKTGMYFNGYRALDNKWKSFDVNGSRAAAAIELGGAVEGRIEFRTASEVPEGSVVPNLRGFVDTDGGLVWGTPTGGSRGRGTTNAEKVYINGVEAFEDASGVYTAGSGALTQVVSDMLRSNTAADIRARIGAAESGGPVAWGDITSKPASFPPSSHTHGFGDLPITEAQVNDWGKAFGWGDHSSAGYAKSGTGADEARTNAQNDSRYWQRSQLTFSLSGSTLTITDNS